MDGWEKQSAEIIREDVMTFTENAVARQTTGVRDKGTGGETFQSIVSAATDLWTVVSDIRGDKDGGGGEGYDIEETLVASGLASCMGLSASVDLYGGEAEPRPSSVTANATLIIPVVWKIEVWVYKDDDGNVVEYNDTERDTGAPLRRIYFRMYPDVRDGKTYSATVTVTVAGTGGISDTDTVSGASMLTYFGADPVALNLTLVLDSNVSVSTSHSIVTWATGDIIAEWNSDQDWAFGDSPFGYIWGPIDVDCDTNVMTATSNGITLDYIDGPSFSVGEVEAESSRKSAAITVEGSFYLGSSAYPGNITIQDKTTTPATDIITDSSFTDADLPLGTYWYVLPDESIVTYPVSGAAHWYGMTWASYGIKAAWLSDNDHPSDDTAIQLCDDESRWPTVLTLTMAASNEIEAFAAIGTWLDVANTTLSIVSGTLQAVVSGGAGSFQNASAAYKIRFRRLLEVSVKGPAGDITMELIDSIMGTKTWTLTLAGTGSQELILIDLMRPNEGPFEGPCLPRHVSHSAAPDCDPSYSNYTIKFSGLVEGGTYQFASLTETRDATDGDHPATAIVRMPADWQADLAEGLYTYSMGRNFTLLSQGVTGLANWWQGGVALPTLPNGPSSEEHGGVYGYRKKLTDGGTSSYVLYTVDAYLTNIDTLLTDAGFTVVKGNTAATGDVYANDHLLAAWMIETTGVNIKTAQTFKAAVQADAIFIQPGFPDAYTVKFTRFLGGQFCGATLGAAGAGNRAVASVGLYATTLEDHSNSDVWTSDTVGAHLGPAVGLPGPVVSPWEWIILNVFNDSTFSTRTLTGRALVKAVGTGVVLGAVTWLDMTEMRYVLLRAINRAGTVKYERSTNGGANWSTYTVSATDAPAGAIWVDATGRVGVLYVSSGAIVQKISTNAHTSAPTWGDEVSIGGSTVKDLDADYGDGTWQYAWIEGASSPYTVKHARSQDGGTTVGTPVTIAADAAEQGIGVTIDTSGVVRITYRLAAGGDIVMISKDLGATWAEVT